jgi:AcrR family transcriptional regulator
MSMDAVAARARSSKATIYRAWPTKPDMVMDALIHHFGDSPTAPDTGSLRGDLLAHMAGVREVANSPEGSVIAGLMSAARLNPELSRTRATSYVVSILVGAGMLGMFLFMTYHLS